MSLRTLFRRSARDRDRADEMQAHLDHATQYYREQGLSDAEARRRARLRFGNPRAHREGVDDLHRLPIADTLRRDLIYAARMLRRTPAFSLTVIATLALTIGATSAVFSLTDAVLLRPLPFPEPERLAVIAPRTIAAGGEYTGQAVDGAMWESVRDHARLVDAAVCGFDAGTVNFISGTTASSVRQYRVGAGYFRVLGIAPFAGREFTPDDDRPNGPAVAILSHGFWQRIFQGRTDAVGKTILLRGRPYDVIGVLPPGTTSLADADVFTPLHPDIRGEGGGTNYQLIARLRPNVSWDQANAELAALGDDPFRLQGHPQDVSRTLVALPMHEALMDAARQPLLILGASVLVVLLLACVNIAALLVARGSTRAKEIATQMALGSGRTAVVRQLMVESALLAGAGGVAGLIAGGFALEGLKSLAGDTFGEWQGAVLDLRTIAVTVGIAGLASLLFGLIPAFQTSRVNLQHALVEGGSRGIAGGPRHVVRRGLVIAEVALGVVLLIGAGLLVRQFLHLRSLDPGFTPDHLYTASVSIQDARYPTAVDVNRLFSTSLERLRQLPGIRAAAISQSVPYSRLLNMPFSIDGVPVDENKPPIADVSYVSDAYFETFDITVTNGRPLDAHDVAATPPVVVVNRTFAQIYFQGESPIGRRLVLAGATREIVGVCRDVQQGGAGFYLAGMRRGPVVSTPTVYLPAAQTPAGLFAWFSPVWTVRAASLADATVALRLAMAAADPLLPLGPVTSMTQIAERATARPRLMMTLIGALAVAAMVLAAIGLHGLIAQSVAERTRELGIRLALGATPGQTLLLVVASALAMAAAGAAIGTLASLQATTLVSSFLFDVAPTDGLTYAGVALLFMAITVVATIGPAAKILRLDPARTLRQ